MKLSKQEWVLLLTAHLTIAVDTGFMGAAVVTRIFDELQQTTARDNLVDTLDPQEIAYRLLNHIRNL